MTTLPTCPREDCTFTGPHHDHDKRTGKVRDRAEVSDCGHWVTALYTRCYAPRTPQPQPAAVVLPTVEECRTAIREAWAAENAIGSGPRVAAQAALDLIAARLPVWHPVEPGAVIKAGTVTRIEWDDREAREEVTRADYTPCQTDPARFYLDPRTVPAEPEDPRVAVVLDWYLSSEAPGTDADLARDLLARLDAVRSDHA